MAILTGDFINGCCSSIEKLNHNVFSCTPDVEEYYIKKGCTNQWYNWLVKIGKAKNQEIVIHLNWPEFKPAGIGNGCLINSRASFVEVLEDVVYMSYDRKHWKRLRDVETDGFTVKIRLFSEQDIVYVSANLPYTMAALKDLLTQMDSSEYSRVQYIGYSYEGRKLPVIQITGEAEEPQNRTSIYLQAAQHPSEMTGCLVIDEMARFLVSDDPLAEEMRENHIFHMTPVVALDGWVKGMQSHPGGVNLNRDWQSFTQPESEAIREYLDEVTDSGEDLVLAIDMHNNWNDREDNGAYITVFSEEDVSSTYVEQQIEFIDEVTRNCDYLEPGSICESPFQPNRFTSAAYRRYGCQAHTFEFSRYDIWDREAGEYVPLTQQRVRNFALDLLKVIHEYF